MDILAHALYGATVCSRTGLAGGRRGASRSGPVIFSLDWTVWAAAGIGILPDLASIGVFFARLAIRGDPPTFHAIPPYVFALYHGTHSLIVAGLILWLVRILFRPLFVPALAWPLHILMDSVSHGDGPWQTLVFYPFSDWHYHGLNWWQHPNLMLVYWGALPVLWAGIGFWRRTGSSRNL